MFEYAISAGEGTLIDYGVCDAVRLDHSGITNLRFHSQGICSGIIANSDACPEEVILWRAVLYECEAGK
jgi:hypothetical protein